MSKKLPIKLKAPVACPVDARHPNPAPRLGDALNVGEESRDSLSPRSLDGGIHAAPPEEIIAPNGEPVFTDALTGEVVALNVLLKGLE